MPASTLPPPPTIEPRPPGYMDEVLKQLRVLHEKILARRGGVPVEVDDILDELRGRTDRDHR